MDHATPLAPTNKDVLIQELKKNGLDAFKARHAYSADSSRALLLALSGKPLKAGLSEAAIAAQLDKALMRILRDRKTLHLAGGVEGAADLIRRSSRVLVLTGAGISTSCGIPDFRSSDGLFAQLQAEAQQRLASAASSDNKMPEQTGLAPTARGKRKAALQATRAMNASSTETGPKSIYDLHDPQEVTDIRVFREHPEIFYSFADRLYPVPGRRPSASHRFIKQLEVEGKLLRDYTQNIDTLETVAGITKHVTCHGSFATASCMRCHRRVPGTEIEADILARRVPTCAVCKPSAKAVRPVMKPDITFFHEPLQPSYTQLLAQDRQVVDLLIVMGTSLPVEPIKDLPFIIPHSVPQILINRERPRVMQPDIWLEGDCDDIVRQLSEQLDWNID